VTRVSRVLTAAFLCVLAGELYLHAATASLFDHYQPGIESLKHWTHPTWLFLGLLALMVAATRWPERHETLERALHLAALGALGVCLVMGGLFLLLGPFVTPRCSHWLPPHRGLAETLRTSLECPNFSNRSYGQPFAGAFLSGVLVALSYLVAKRKPPLSRGPAAKNPARQRTVGVE
jgi:hypothetical protein